MHLTAYTDYALRVLIYLAVDPQRQSSIAEVSEAYGISRNHVVKVVHHLARAGLIHTLRGRGGGMRLARDPGTITVGEVIRITEREFALVECFRGERNRCPITGACTLSRVLHDALGAFLAVVDAHTLAQLVDKPDALGPLFHVSAIAPVNNPPGTAQTQTG